MEIVRGEIMIKFMILYLFILSGVLFIAVSLCYAAKIGDR